MATVSIGSVQLANWQDRNSSVELLIFCSPGFIGSNGVPIPSGSTSDKVVYKRVPCTVNTTAKTLTISAFTLMSTTDGLDIQTAVYNAWFFAVRGDKIGAEIKAYDGFSEFRVPTTASQNWIDISLYNLNYTSIIQNPNAYTKDQSLALFAPLSTVLNAAQLNVENAWSARQTLPRTLISETPNFDLASGALATDFLSSHVGAVVPAGKTFSGLRLGQDDGNANTYTIASGGLASNLASFAKSLSGSHASSNLYAQVIQTDNAGPGTAKSLHVLSTGISGSTGILAAASFDVDPVSGQGATFAVQIASSGIDDLVRGIVFTTNGGNFDYGLDFVGYSTIPEYNSGAIRLPNNAGIVGENAASSGIVSMMKLNATDVIEFGNHLAVNAANAYVQVGADLDGWLFQKIDSGGRLRLFKQSVGEILAVLPVPGSDEVGLMLYVNNSGTTTLRQVSIGANDSGGSGFCLLRVPN